MYRERASRGVILLKLFLTPYFAKASAIIIKKIRNSAFSVTLNCISSPPFRFHSLNKSVPGVANRSLPY